VSDVCPSVIGLVTARPALLVLLPMVTLPDAALTNLPLAVAVAVITAPGDKLSPVSVHALVALEVVVPTDTLFENTSIVVPLASVVDPEMEFTVVAEQYVPCITGAAEVVVTVFDVEALEMQFVPDSAFAVMTCPNVNVRLATVQFVPEAVVVPICVPSAYK
jgi:hypothetical protein